MEWRRLDEWRFKAIVLVCLVAFFIVLHSPSNAQENAPKEIYSDSEKQTELEAFVIGDIDDLLANQEKTEAILAWTEQQEGEYYAAAASYIKIIAWKFWDFDAYDCMVIGNQFSNHCHVLPIKTQINGLGEMALRYGTIGRHEEKLALIKRLCELKQQLDETSECLELGKVYYDLKQYRKAIAYFELNVRQYKAEQNVIKLASAYNDIGSCYERMSLPDSALWAYKKALGVLLLNEGVNTFSDFYLGYFTNIVRYNLWQVGRTKKDSPVNRALVQNIINGAYKAGEGSWVVVGYLYFAQINYEADNLNLALAYSDSAVSVAKKYSLHELVPIFLELKGKTMLLKGEKAVAHKFFLQAYELKDSLALVNSEKQGMVAAAQYQAQEKEKEIARVTQEVKNAAVLAQQEQKNKRNIIIGALLITILALILGFLVVRLKQAQKLERAQSNSLQESLKVKEVLLKEIHHRVKNNLQVISSLLDLQSLQLEDIGAKAALEEGKSRVQTIAILHHQLYQLDDIARVELRPFVDELAMQILDVFKKPDQQVEIDINVPEEMLEIDVAVPLGLILNELLTNSFKYAFTATSVGKIELSFISELNAQTGENIKKLVYRDNGPGLPEGIDFAKISSLGLRLVFKLSKQFKGTTTYRYNDGSEFSISFT